MLKTEWISKIEIHSDQWRIARIGKFTSSRISELMSDKLLTKDGVAYINTRVGEEMTGIPSASEYVDTPDTRHGLLYEPVAIKKFGEHRQLEFLVVQKLITIPGTRFGSTPDALVILQKYGDAYDVETVEVKCYPNYNHFISCVLCETPQQLKEVDRKLYWQVIDQMYNCEALRGNAVLYHPDFRAGGFRVIPFRKRELADDFKLLQERKTFAVKKFDEIRERLLALKN